MDILALSSSPLDDQSLESESPSLPSPWLPLGCFTRDGKGLETVSFFEDEESKVGREKEASPFFKGTLIESVSCDFNPRSCDLLPLPLSIEGVREGEKLVDSD